MKKLFTLILVALVVLSCSKDDGVGAYAISGSPEITSLEAGYKRVIVTWAINATMDDAALSNIYWDGGESSTGQYLTSDTGSSITVEITDLAEGEYTFYAQNATPTSNKYSAPSESITVYVYGEAYCKSLEQRSIASTDFVEGDDDGVGQRIDITWGTAPSGSGCIGTYLNYYNRAGDLTAKFCALSESVTELDDALVGTDFNATTLYLLADCIDTLVSTATDTDALPVGSGPILVGSPKAMQPYFAMDNVHVILDTGEYEITADNILNQDFYSFAPQVAELTNADGTDSGEGYITDSPRLSLFYVAGNNSIYDFGNSTITVPTTVYQYIVGLYSQKCDPIRFTGNYNTFKNLIYIDEGVSESTQTGITNVTIDGKYNVLENLTLHSTGSSPYGYGELFGKGGSNTISHQKHCGVLVRGDYNHVLNCNIHHRAYGHCLFMQGAEYPTIEGCNISADITTTQAVYAELGSGSPADNVDFLTYFGYHMSENYNYTISLSEEGIRAYDSGITIIDGVPYVRGAVNTPTVKDCVVKNARGGVTLSHTTGNAWVENTTVIGCGRGFAVRKGATIKNCYADAQFGPAFGVDYDWHGGNSIEITIVDNSSSEWITANEARSGWLSDPNQLFETCNGTAQIAQIKGSSGQNVKFRDGRVNDTSTSVKIKPSDWGTYPDKSVVFARIDLGGDDRNLGALWLNDQATEVVDENGDGTGVFSAANAPETIDDDDAALKDSYIANETDYPVYIDANVSGCTIWSNGMVILETGATGNTIYIGNGATFIEAGLNAADSNTIIYEDWDIDTCFTL